MLKLYRKYISPLQQSVSFQEIAFYHIVAGLCMSMLAVKITTKDLKAKWGIYEEHYNKNQSRLFSLETVTIAKRKIAEERAKL